MMERYFKGVQPHINIEKIEAKIAFLPCPPERALEIVKNFPSYEKVTEQREFVTYKGDREGKNVCVTSMGIGCPSAAIGDGRVARHCQINRRVHGERRRGIFNYDVRITSQSNS